MKWRRAHSSAILFCIGVPVRRRRLRQLKLSRVFQRILQKFREVPCHAFVIMCKWLIDIAKLATSLLVKIFRSISDKMCPKSAQ